MLFNTKKSIKIAFSSLVITGTSFVGAIYAQEYRYPPADALEPPVQNAAPTTITRQPARVNQGYPMPYPAQNFPPQRRFNPAPVYGAPGNRPMPYRPAPYGPAPIAGARPMGPGMPPPYGNPYNRHPYNNSGPFNNSPFGGGPFNNSPFGGGGPFKNMGFGPFNNNSAPWETWPFGGRDSFWSRKDMPFDQQNPTDWFNPGDPKEGLAIMWDDLISAPDDLGTMPGGWHVPSVSVPNPVDLEDQMEKATKEIPDLIRVYN